MKKLRNCPSLITSISPPHISHTYLFLNPTAKSLKIGSTTLTAITDSTTTTTTKADQHTAMVAVATTMAWLADIGSIKRTFASESKKVSFILDISSRHAFRQEKSSPQQAILGILAFETAKIMSRLVALYKSLSDDEIYKLIKEVIRSEGVAFLNSKDEAFLLSLAFMEKVEELDHVAMAVSRLGRKCTDFGLTQFDLAYADLKLGIFDLEKLEFASKNIEKIIEKMEKYIATTSSLYSALESLSDMEASERKFCQWKKAKSQKINNFDVTDTKIAYQRKKVRHFNEISLWSQPFDKSVGLMARIVCIVYARICKVFEPYISGIIRLSSRQIRPHKRQHKALHSGNFCLPEDHPTDHSNSKFGPIPKTSRKATGRFPSPESNYYFPNDDIGLGSDAFRNDRNEKKTSLYLRETKRNNKVFQAAPPSTVGGSGLALRYANVILLAERYLHLPTVIGEGARAELYHMLPESLKLMMKSKLKKISRSNEEDELLAEGWRDALEGIMEWLTPLAHDTVRWHECHSEKQRFHTAPSVLLLQTLHYSDKEKTEASITEVLVGLSYIYRCENRFSGGGDGRYSYR